MIMSYSKTNFSSNPTTKLMNNVTQNANWFKSVEEVHEMLTGSVVLWNEYTEIYGAIFAIHLDTDGMWAYSSSENKIYGI